MRFKDKVVMVTGGAAGIGRVTAEAFAQEGAKLAICARTAAKLDDAEREVAVPRRVARTVGRHRQGAVAEHVGQRPPEVGLDRRAGFTVEDRRAQYAAARTRAEAG